MSIWTAPLKEHASKLWKEGYNVRQIIEAMQLPVSRNSIIGIATRNRELFPKKQKGYHGGRKPKTENVEKPIYAPKLAFGYWSSIPKPPKPIETAPDAEAPISLRKTLMQRGTFECVWITEGTGANAMFCAHETKRSDWYCAYHLGKRKGSGSK